MNYVSVLGLYLFKSINLRNSEVETITGAPISTTETACVLFNVLCTNSRDRFCFEFTRREEVEAWLPMRHYFPLCVGCQEVLNENECVMRREPKKSQAGSRRNMGVNAPLFRRHGSKDNCVPSTTRSTGEKEHKPYSRVDYSLRGDRNRQD